MSEEERAAARAAEARVRALRDTLLRVSSGIEEGSALSLRDAVHDPLLRACEAIEEGDLGKDAATVGTQFEAFFERLRGLVEANPDPVPADALGLPADARFLRDMADYITRRYGLEDEE